MYDNDLTDAFFSCLARLCSLATNPPAVLVSLEKRYIQTLNRVGQDSNGASVYLSFTCRLNFSLEDLAVVSPYYQHFKRCLGLSYSTSRGNLVFHAQCITTDFPQCSDYDRVEELVRNIGSCVNIA